ncbi:hypothetical protein ASE75_06045 [Sphingomonas sp. Leaf17]|uniref:DUF6441 family protein n=1 Tax=Sphingomonas sp. Leaf17 TaxID=1735683 RepID=UPI0006FA9B6E|nr:DUF6441 family protein [Sphingomonas sp. Leaf17]KQM65790.1 hypothetical protein ASE75_06045 [Sphingomonas sp. Leaf17]
MKVDIEMPDFAGLMIDLEGDVAKAATGAMRATTRPTVAELREQIVSNGLSKRLANTWRDRVYPEQRESMNPSGYIWSNAPEIITSFVEGATIRPVNGAKYLWIPTKNVPTSRGRTSTRGKRIKGGRMSPEELENHFNADLTVRKGRAGTVLAFMDVVAARNARSLRRVTKGRLRQGRKAEPVLMYVLRKTVTMPRILDLRGPAGRWEASFLEDFNRRMMT